MLGVVLVFDNVEDLDEIEFRDMFDRVLCDCEGDGEDILKLLLVNVGVAGKDFGRSFNNSLPLSV